MPDELDELGRELEPVKIWCQDWQFWVLDGSVVSWGFTRFATLYAIKSDGSVVSWERDSSDTCGKCRSATGRTGLRAIMLDGSVVTWNSFGTPFAIKSDGSVVTWGRFCTACSPKLRMLSTGYF